MSRLVRIRFVVAVFALSTPDATLRGQGPDSASAPDQIRQALQNPVTLEFVETPLSDVIGFLKDYTSLNFVFDRGAIEEAGATGETPVSIHVQAIRLDSAMNQLLKQIGLTWIVQNDCIVITSQQVAGSSVSTRTYPVGEVVQTEEEAKALQSMVSQLLTASGSTATDRMLISEPLKSLVLTDTRKSHSLVHQLLTQLRGESQEPDTVKKIKARLADPVTLEFVETPMSDVFDFLRDHTHINILIDRPSLEEEGITSDTPLTIRVNNISLRSALKIMLAQYNLTFRIEDECLVVMSHGDGEGQFDLRVIPMAKYFANRPAMEPKEWRRILQTLVPPAESKEERQSSDRAGSRPFVDLYAPRQAVVVFGPPSLHDRVTATLEMLAGNAK